MPVDFDAPDELKTCAILRLSKKFPVSGEVKCVPLSEYIQTGTGNSSKNWLRHRTTSEALLLLHGQALVHLVK